MDGPPAWVLGQWPKTPHRNKKQLVTKYDTRLGIGGLL
jgi:hypothetical protein